MFHRDNVPEGIEKNRDATTPQTNLSIALNRERHRPRVPLDELPLMPVRINWRPVASLVELRNLRGSQIPTHSLQILPKLLFIPRTDHHIHHGRSLQTPVQSNDRNPLSSLPCDFVQSVHHAMDIFVCNLRPVIGGL